MSQDDEREGSLDIEVVRARLAAEGAQLADYEVRWRDRQEFLASKGYMLRPRYHPGWIASWTKNPNLDPLRCEDYHVAPLRLNLIDATRMSDGVLVYIKRMYTGSKESEIAKYMVRDEICDDPRNHSVPVLDLFEDEDDGEISYLVMPFLRPINRPPFALVDEVRDFVDQIFEGLIFMHSQGIAHRDCTAENIMMDGNCLYPRGFHPVELERLPDGRTLISHLPRWKHQVKYYFVDYGISVHKQAGDPVRFARGEDGRDREVPELHLDTPYDPFKLDIFIVGNMFERMFVKEYNNVGFLRPLIQYMKTGDPDARPDATQAFEKWKRIRDKLLMVQRSFRLRAREDPAILAFFYDIDGIVHVPLWFAHRISNAGRRLLRSLR